VEMLLHLEKSKGAFPPIAAIAREKRASVA